METTIQIHRLANDPAIRQKIRSELADKALYTTSFVLRELLRTIIRDLAYVHSIVQDIGSKDDGIVALKRLLHVLGRGECNYSSRAARREMHIVAGILEHFDERNLRMSELLVFLQWTADQWLEEFFEIDLPNGGRHRIEDDGFMTGLDESPDEVLLHIQRCEGIPIPAAFPRHAGRFLKERSILVSKLIAHLEAAENNATDKRLLETLRWLWNDKRGEFEFDKKLSIKSRRGWALGDLLIALEAPSGTEIYTTDRHYDRLCEFLGTRVYDGYCP